MSSSNTAPRVRFAPSPTGWLHIGGVRTALFNYLYAKKHGGKFLMRIEDTDLDRSEQLYTDDIMSSLKWLGLEHEEEVLYQSKRLDLYRKIADELVSRDLAYYCYATEEEVEAGRVKLQAEGKKPMYDRAWRERKADANGADGRTSYAIRAKFPMTGTTAFTDMIRGEISFPNEDLDDFVMIRSNGVPTYNFVVVVDDIEMAISHVIRGDDHINNTPKQVFLYDAMKKAKPLFAHLPMILGQDKKKLSKRNGETSTNAYRNEGYLPEALLNFLVRLGWSHGDQELFSVQEMIDFFNFENVQVSGAVFNSEKLLWIQGEHIKKADPARLLAIVKQDFAAKFSPESLKRLDTPIGLELVKHIQLKVKLIKELAEQMHPLLESAPMPVDASGLKWNKDPAQKEKIKAAISVLTQELADRIEKSGKTRLQDTGLDHTGVDALLRGISEKTEVKLGDLTQPMRLFVTGQATSAIGLFDLFPLLEWSVIEARLKACLQA